MPKITITGVPGVDGDYPLDLDDQFTGRELHLIKTVSGVRVGEIEEAMNAADYDLIIALAKIALNRSGRTDVTTDRLLDLKAGSIQLRPTEEEEAAEQEQDDRPLPSEPPKLSELRSSGSGSGSSSNSDSDLRETHPNGSGSPSSVESSQSVPPI